MFLLYVTIVVGNLSKMLRFGVAVEWIHDLTRGVYSSAAYMLHYFIENAQVWSSGKVDPRLKLLYLNCMA